MTFGIVCRAVRRRGRSWWSPWRNEAS